MNRLAQRLAPRTVEVVYRHLSAALKAALRDRLIARTPCVEIKLPRYDRPKIVPPTREQLEALADAMTPRYRAAVVLSAGGGLRLGEVFGLKVDRLDFLGRQVRIEEQLLTPNSGPAHLGPLKTAASTRTVALADVVLEEMSQHLAAYPWVNEFVFTTEMDNAVRRGTFYAAWDRARKVAGAESVRFHDLRHFYASALIRSGCSVRVVQEALGHASAVETLETYTHLWPDDEDGTRAAIQSILVPEPCATDVQPLALVEAS